MSGVDLTIEAAVAATGGTLLRGGPARFAGVAIDSRRVQRGQAFVAIAGDRFDGHDYWHQAAQLGAVLLVMQRPPQGELPSDVALLVVSSTRAALGQLARAWRREVDPTTVAITGSVGKTTTKELTRALVALLGATHSNPGNFNNDIGLPLTLLSMARATRYLVVEMGMNAPGEIAHLAELARPQVGVVTSVAPVHLEGLGSVQAVAEAKGELLRGLPPGGWAVVPGDESLLVPSLASVPAQRCVRFGEAARDEVQIVEATSRGEAGSRVRLMLGREEVAFDLPLVGAHNARNAAAAAGAALVLGLAPSRMGHALESIDPACLTHRSSLRRVGHWRLFDDCYNSNPVATRAALDTLTALARGEGAVAVLGDMLELGDEAERYHLELGGHAAAARLDLLVTVGSLGATIARGALRAGMPDERVVHVEDPEGAAEAVQRKAAPGAWVLVKGSRGARLERVIEALSGTGSGRENSE